MEGYSGASRKEREDQMATDLTIEVEDKPGSLASIGEALGGSGINIEGLFGASVDGRGLIHLCVQDGPAARKALEGAGLSVTDEADAILGEAVAGASDPGTMGMMARQIANAGINVKAAYIATGNRVVMVTDNNAKLTELIANM
jgi:hypothetical protein